MNDLKPPKNKWLICWNDKPDIFNTESFPDIFMAYFSEDEKGEFWMRSQGDINEECEPPKNWREWSEK